MSLGLAKVLVVDDSPTILRLVSQTLSKNGYAVITASDGAVALEKLNSGEEVDLVLLDLVMPQMNGYQFCRALRSGPHKNVPVVLMSAKSEDVRAQFVEQTGAVDAIGKPFDPSALLIVLEGAIERTAQGRTRPVPDGEAMPEDDTLTSYALRLNLMPAIEQDRASRKIRERLTQILLPKAAMVGIPPEKLAPWLESAMPADVLIDLSSAFRILAPEKRDDVLSGTLDAIAIAEILQLLQLGRQTGVLAVSGERRNVFIFIRNGQIELAQARGFPEEYRAGRYFVETGVLSPTELKGLLDEQARHNAKGSRKVLLGELALEREKASPEDVKEALRAQSSELVYELLRFTHGSFVFRREEIRREARSAALGLGIQGLLLEGFRRVDEWRIMEKSIVFDDVLLLDRLALESIRKGSLEPTDDKVLSAVDGKRTVREIIRESGVGSFQATAAIYRLLESRVLRPKSVLQ